MIYDNQNVESFDVFQTHMEIYPYTKGLNFQFEKTLSTWNDVKRRYEPLGYFIKDKKLYLPRGLSLERVGSIFGVAPNTSFTHDKFSSFKKYKISKPPKDKLQLEIIDFLTSNGKFVNGNLYSQFGLHTNTGSGKTYCSCNAVLQMRIKTIIITHQDKIKNQWINTFLEMSDIPRNELVNINGINIMEKIMDEKINGSIYFVNHQTIHNYAKTYGWDALKEFFKKNKIGIKIYDEAHKFFSSILMIDFFSNVYRTYYITATFTRSNYSENKIFKQAFSNVYKYGMETKKDTRKHVIYVPVLYNSNPPSQYLAKMQTAYGFSSYAYIDYALHKDENNTLENVLIQVMSKVYDEEGKHLVVSPKIESVNILSETLKKYFMDEPAIIHSKSDKNTEESYEEIEYKRLISSTIKSLGTGVDIPGLRFLYCLEPHSSKSLTEQLVGRLREYSKDKNTIFFDFFDTGVPQMYLMYKSHMAVMKDIAVEIKELRY